MTSGADPWASLRARANQPPLSVREPLLAAVRSPGGGVRSVDTVIGSIEPALARRLADAGCPLVPDPTAGGWRVVGAAGPALDASLARIAIGLREVGAASAWRDELLAVEDAAGERVGAIERAAVRPLGIVTRAVHLIGWAEQGGMWVQQRALDKSTDPGLWDTLMGGLMADGETIAETLGRETWEEAGLRIETLRDVRATRTVTVRRPLGDGHYMIEHIHVHEATVPATASPSNQDGEVAAFARIGDDDLRARLGRDEFTLEAALILVDALGRRERTGIPR